MKFRDKVLEVVPELTAEDQIEMVCKDCGLAFIVNGDMPNVDERVAAHLRICPAK